MAVFEERFIEFSGLLITVVGGSNNLVPGKLLISCLEFFSRHRIGLVPASEQLDAVWVPIGFQIPLVAHRLAASGRYKVVITHKAVLRGDTLHFDNVSSEVSKGVAALVRDRGMPVNFGVVTTDTLQQALERAGIKSSLGSSYALQALDKGSLMRALPSPEAASATW